MIYIALELGGKMAKLDVKHDFFRYVNLPQHPMNRTKKTWTQEIDERFLQAVLEGNLEQARNYADKGADLYQMDEEGRCLSRLKS